MSYFYLDSPSTKKSYFPYTVYNYHNLIIVLPCFLVLGESRYIIYQLSNATAVASLVFSTTLSCGGDHPSVLVTGAGRGRTNLCSVRLVKSTAQMLCHTATIMSCVESVDHDFFLGLCNRGIIRALLTIC